MIQTKKLKIWIIVTHALIIIGLGHGMACFGLLEVIGLAGTLKQLFTFHFSELLNIVSAISLLIISGQVMIIASLYQVNRIRKLILYILGIIFLWFSLFGFMYYAANEESAAFLAPFCLPFFVCTIIAFFGTSIKRFFYWMIDKDFAQEE